MINSGVPPRLAVSARIAELVIAAASVGSICVAMSALNEARLTREALIQQLNDEQERHEDQRDWARQPFLAFKTETDVLQVRSVGESVLENGDVRQVEPGGMKEGVQETKPFATLVNYGPGPAFDIRVVWEVNPADNRRSPMFQNDNNMYYSSPMFCLPGQSVHLTNLPRFVTSDPADVPQIYEGGVAIEYCDADLQKHRTYQAFEIHLRPGDSTGRSHGTVSVRFGKLKMLSDYGTSILKRR